MVIILDTSKGESYYFTTKKEAGRFLKITQPTLRKYLQSPFYLYRKLILTESNKARIAETKSMVF